MTASGACRSSAQALVTVGNMPGARYVCLRKNRHFTDVPQRDGATVQALITIANVRSIRYFVQRLLSAYAPIFYISRRPRLLSAFEH